MLASEAIFTAKAVVKREKDRKKASEDRKERKKRKKKRENQVSSSTLDTVNVTISCINSS